MNGLEDIANQDALMEHVDFGVVFKMVLHFQVEGLEPSVEADVAISINELPTKEKVDAVIHEVTKQVERQCGGKATIRQVNDTRGPILWPVPNWLLGPPPEDPLAALIVDPEKLHDAIKAAGVRLGHERQQPLPLGDE